MESGTDFGSTEEEGYIEKRVARTLSQPCLMIFWDAKTGQAQAEYRNVARWKN